MEKFEFNLPAETANTPPTPEAETKPEQRPEVLEENLSEKENFLRQEAELFSTREKEIIQEPNPEKRKKRFAKLNAYILTTMIVLGITGEAMADRVMAGQVSKEKAGFVEKINVQKIEQQREENYENIKKIFEEEKIEEKLNFLKEKYGEVIDSFLFLNKINRNVEAIKNVDLAIKEKNSEAFINKSSPFAVTPGSILFNLKENWTPLNKEEKLEKSKEFKISGFENISGLTNEEVKKQLLGKYPYPWLAGSLKGINYVPEITYKYDEKGKPVLQVLGSAQRYGMESMLQQDNRTVLRIFKDSESAGKEEIMSALDHEIAHSNDWENSRILSNQERINFLYDVTMAFGNAGHFETPYVESLSNPDKKMENYLKAKEYWAEINKVYVNLDQEGKEKFKKGFEKDVQLFEKWFKIINE